MLGPIYKAKTASRPARPAPKYWTEALSAALAAVDEGLAVEPEAVPEAAADPEADPSTELANCGQKQNTERIKLTTGTSRLGGRVGRGARATSSSTTARSSGTSTTVLESSLAAGEEAVDAGVDTLGVGLGGGRGSITLVALGSAFVGGNGLRGVGAGVTQALGLAVDVASIAVQGALDGRCESGSHGSGG